MKMHCPNKDSLFFRLRGDFMKYTVNVECRRGETNRNKLLGNMKNHGCLVDL